MTRNTLLRACAWGVLALGSLLMTTPVDAEPPAAQATAADAPCAAAQAPAPAQPIDLNTADERALLDLPGIGPARARAILDYRASHGGFRSVSQLLQIKGIGRALLKQLRPLVTLSPAP